MQKNQAVLASALNKPRLPFSFFSAAELPLDIGTTVIKSLQEIGDFSEGKVILVEMPSRRCKPGAKTAGHNTIFPE